MGAHGAHLAESREKNPLGNTPSAGAKLSADKQQRTIKGRDCDVLFLFGLQLILRIYGIVLLRSYT